jgi:outer membrane protein assembly factor BamB
MGFDLYDRAGTKLQSVPVTGELLDLSISADERFVALSLTGGRVQVLDLESLKAAWEVKVRGQMIGVSISSGPEPLLSVFFYKKSDTGKHQATLALYGSGGKLVDQLTLEGQFEQVAISPNAQIKEAWRHSSPRYSDYNSPLVVTDQRTIVGFEDGPSAESGKSFTHLFSFDRGGKVEWAIPLVSDEGGYLFAYSREGSEPILLGVTDNGEVSAFRIQN